MKFEEITKRITIKLIMISIVVFATVCHATFSKLAVSNVVYHNNNSTEITSSEVILSYQTERMIFGLIGLYLAYASIVIIAISIVSNLKKKKYYKAIIDSVIFIFFLVTIATNNIIFKMDQYARYMDAIWP